ncbi:MAG: glycosyltransferase, partial [bacterium]
MDTNINPKISIIMVTLNMANFIAKAIESIQKQGFSNWELLVLDDNSKDNTEIIVENFVAKDKRIKY